MMKPGVEARDLRQPRQQSLESFDQSDFRREMVDVERADPAQFRDQLGRDRLRTMITRPSVHDPVSDTGESVATNVLLEPVDEHFGRRPEIGGD